MCLKRVCSSLNQHAHTWREFHSRQHVSRTCFALCQINVPQRRFPETKCRFYRAANEHEGMSRIRNIGIMAHIDAGKTTTTERMLYYSGFTRHLGDVDDGDTVMDYMDQERDRGITITSAAITFHWNQHKINLIDTPGHVDFTVEVERCLRVLDGAVTVLDASAGVEAQTLTVWRQADRYSVPRIVFLNKMDKNGADVSLCLSSLQEKLKVEPLLINVPVGKGKGFEGIIDLITMEKIVWNSDKCTDGNTFERSALDHSDGVLYAEVIKARSKLIGQLADIDEKIAEYVLSDVKLDDIPSSEILHAIRHATVQQKVIPVLCGSSLKNKGVQPLMDAIIHYLPSPLDKNYGFAEFYGSNLCALAFKVIHDKQRGVLTFLRLYSGSVKSGASVYNVTRQCAEKTSRLLQVYANEFHDLSTAVAGNIVLVAGMKETYTGDTITSGLSSAKAAAKAYCTQMKKSKLKSTSVDDKDEVEMPVLAGVDVPAPVFFCSIEPPTLTAQKQLDYALQCLQREDPSLKVDVNQETGQTILSGMGELHLDITRSRIQKEYGIEVDLGPLQIAYRETISEVADVEDTLDRVIGDKHHVVGMRLSVHPDIEMHHLKHVSIDAGRDSHLDGIKKRHLQAIESGILSALANGPILNFPVIDVDVRLHSFHLGPGTSMAMVSACASQCTHKALQEANPQLLEPMMAMEINTDEEKLHAILGDLAQRRSHIHAIENRQNVRVVKAVTPLAELMGYSTAIRTISSGTATVTMELFHYQRMTPQEQNKAIHCDWFSAFILT